MKRRLSDLRLWILESPTSKALISTVLAAAIGVLSGSFVTEITTLAGLEWGRFHKTWSVYGLLAVTAAQVVYSRLLYNYEIEIMKFLDGDYCIAYLRSKCLPEVAEKYKTRIRNGQGGEFKDAMDEIREVLK